MSTEISASDVAAFILIVVPFGIVCWVGAAWCIFGAVMWIRGEWRKGEWR